MATNYVSLSSNQKIREALRNLSRRQFSNNRVIGPNNRYLKDTITKTNASSFATTSIHVSDIAQYIGASILQHCLDGWNFISRSTEALLSGDISTAIHMAYYSELRSAMSILASEGIGIFDSKHLYFDLHNIPQPFERNSSNRKIRTHLAAKELMEEWASLSNKKQGVFRCIQVNNHSLSDWISASGHSASSGYASSLLETWLTRWSIDLNLDIDQRLRNETSYRPHYKINQVNPSSKIDQIIGIWQILEPSGSSNYEYLDRHILRLTLEGLFRISTGRSIRHSLYKSFIDLIFDNLGESKQQQLYEFIFRRVDPQDHLLFTEAKKDSTTPAFNHNDPMPMLCRAILLQRLTTGIARNIFTDSSVNFSRLSFWWQDIAYKYGIIDQNPTSLTTIDLYADVDNSIQSVNSTNGVTNSVKAVNNTLSYELYSLKQFQKICFWGMGL